MNTAALCFSQLVHREAIVMHQVQLHIQPRPDSNLAGNGADVEGIGVGTLGPANITGDLSTAFIINGDPGWP